MSSNYISEKLRQAVRKLARGRCEYCQWLKRFSPDPFEFDHISPRARGGPTLLFNLAYACRGCNLNKSDKIAAKDSVTGKVVPLFHPRRQRWREHFAWIEDWLTVIGLTPTGRATVTALELNREELINIRGVLHLCGFHPPV